MLPRRSSMENISMSFLQLPVRRTRLSLTPINVALALMMMATATGVAQAGDEVPTETVRIDRSNLTTDAGSRAVFQQLSNASRRVCRVDDSRELIRLVHAQSCYKEALGKAVLAVQNERVTQLYRAKVGAG
jgi:UrcA family protein